MRIAERMIGTIRRELLAHVIVLNAGHLRRRLRSYLSYYHASRTHLALEKDAPEPRAVEPPETGPGRCAGYQPSNEPLRRSSSCLVSAIGIASRSRENDDGNRHTNSSDLGP